ncbi:MAG: GTPase HflX [Bacteroidia bacterium]
MHQNLIKKETAVLVGLITRQQPEEKATEYLDELAFLAETAGAITRARFVQRLDKPDPRTYVGSGKLEEIEIYVRANEIDLVLVDDELSASQMRNIEKVFNPDPLEARVKLLDRSTLILDIFASRAQTAQAKTQVELAQHEYLLPRLTRMWTHLSKQKGGIGMKGPGEKEIETDRRIIRNRISLLKERLKQIDQQNATQRKNRGKSIRVALVGYTNVGKSTLMNLLSKSEVFAENKLFATLDATVRKVVVNHTPFLLSDTVGFIRKLPHHLVESFKSTLDEVRESDILLHVVDLSHPNFEEQMDVVLETLRDINAGDKTILTVFNKIDRWEAARQAHHDEPEFLEAHPPIASLEKSWMARSSGNCIFISAADKINIDELRDRLANMVKTVWFERYPHSHDFF